ncbi:transposase [Rhodohalobacter sp. WB101]|uniref:Transposase n=2 Tax=Rhodohalobacter sulfatireducens TaxID=2911366 RepID=A0ABS9K8P2_9BACT|nr:transposase [Rhodohalobacter sulfatireducens]
MPKAMQPRTRRRARDLATGLLNCAGKRTISGLLCGAGRQFADWSAAYRLFSQQRVDPQRLLDVSLRQTIDMLPDDELIVAHLDDTLIRKTGRKIPGTKWRRDPLGPPFHTNFIWGQRFVQFSVACPDSEGSCRARAIPVTFTHAPSPVKPRKEAPAGQWEAYHSSLTASKVTRVGREGLTQLRDRVDQAGGAGRHMIVSVDGSYTNKEIVKYLPERTTLVGRIRKDAKLYRPADGQPPTGRRRVYGERLPTPEQLRRDEAIAWQSVKGFAAGREHTFDVKIISPVKWRSAGGNQTLQLIIIRPLGYRLSNTSKILYRQPAYLICNDLEHSIERILQAYLWRWEIEVNFREQKTLMGCGQAQVRNERSAETVPQFVTGVYSLLMVAADRLRRQGVLTHLCRAKWYPRKHGDRWTTGDICNRFRAEEYTRYLGWSFSDFVARDHQRRTAKKQANPAISALINMRY